MDAGDPKTDHLVLQLEGGGWEPLDWSPDNKSLLALEEVSINQSYLWLGDLATGKKKLLTPKSGEENSYNGARFSRDGKGNYATTDRETEFQRLADAHPGTIAPAKLTPA